MKVTATWLAALGLWMVTTTVLVLFLLWHTYAKDVVTHESLELLREDVESLQVEINALADPDGGAFHMESQPQRDMGPVRRLRRDAGQ